MITFVFRSTKGNKNRDVGFSVCKTSQHIMRLICHVKKMPEYNILLEKIILCVKFLVKRTKESEMTSTERGEE